MKIALLNKRITIEKQQTVTDRIGNHKNEWVTWHECHATVSGEGNKGGGETEAVGTTVDHADCYFTVRWCNALRAVSTTNYRIVMDGEIYDILSIDHFSYRKKALKFRCRKVRR